MTLANRTCVPSPRGARPLTSAQIAPLRKQVPRWKLIAHKRLQRDFKFKDFKGALAFVNAIGKEAEAQQHHPDLELSWGRVGATLFTHTVRGLSEADFIMAARIDRAHKRLA